MESIKNQILITKHVIKFYSLVREIDCKNIITKSRDEIMTHSNK
jgi:hypothetical protein